MNKQKLEQKLKQYNETKHKSNTSMAKTGAKRSMLNVEGTLMIRSFHILKCFKRSNCYQVCRI